VALVALVMIGLVGAGYVGRGLVDAHDSSGTALVDRDLLNSPALTGESTGDEASTPLLDGTDEEPARAVANALGPSVVVIRTDAGLGSGVVYDRQGLIMTNAHVVGSSSTVTVTLDDGRSLTGTVAGADAVTDIAVVRIDPPDGLVAARLAVDPPEAGALVVALGSPFGLERTITAGIVSAAARPVGNGAGGVIDMVQTDAAINPGNSGGALANRRAEVVGINSMIYSQSGDNSGIGFAIPIARARSVADRLVAGQPIDQARLGVVAGPTDVGAAPGARLRTVEAGSAAERAGLVPGDVVVAVDGLPVRDPVELAGAVADHDPGQTVTVSVRRGDQRSEVSVTLGAARPATVDPGAQGRTPRPSDRPG
jgi:putative serine protease PepD